MNESLSQQETPLWEENSSGVTSRSRAIGLLLAPGNAKPETWWWVHGIERKELENNQILHGFFWLVAGGWQANQRSLTRRNGFLLPLVSNIKYVCMTFLNSLTLCRTDVAHGPAGGELRAGSRLTSYLVRMWTEVRNDWLIDWTVTVQKRGLAKGQLSSKIIMLVFFCCTLAGLAVRFLLAGLACGSVWLLADWPSSPLQA